MIVSCFLMLFLVGGWLEKIKIKQSSALGGLMFTELCNNCTINNTGILAAITFHVILNLGGFATSKLFIDAFDTCHQTLKFQNGKSQFSSKWRAQLFNSCSAAVGFHNSAVEIYFALIHFAFSAVIAALQVPMSAYRSFCPQQVLQKCYAVFSV